MNTHTLHTTNTLSTRFYSATSIASYQELSTWKRTMSEEKVIHAEKETKVMVRNVEEEVVLQLILNRQTAHTEFIKRLGPASSTTENLNLHLFVEMVKPSKAKFGL